MKVCSAVTHMIVNIRTVVCNMYARCTYLHVLCSYEYKVIAQN